jgi:hypothetical protein
MTLNGMGEMFVPEWLVAPHVIEDVVEMLSKDKV